MFPSSACFIFIFRSFPHSLLSAAFFHQATSSDPAAKRPREEAPTQEPTPKKAHDAPETSTPAPAPGADLGGKPFSVSI